VTAVCASTLVPQAPERVYAFVADLENHSRLSERYMRLEGLRPDGRGGRVSIRTPFGLRRTARTSVTAATAPYRFGGTAAVGRRTRAHAYWTIEPSEHGARVGLEATVCDAGWVDRLLLAIGGRWWLRRRFRHVLAGLASVLEQSPAPVH
jgi:hypothetical protein